MPLESGDFIPDLNLNNPLGSDPKSEGDDHIRLIKRCTQQSFGAFVGNQTTPKSVNLTEDQINDAALKSETATISAAWLFTAQVDHSAPVVLAHAIQLRGLDNVGTPVRIAEVSGAAVNIGSFTDNLRSDCTGRFEMRVDTLIAGRAIVPADGGIVVADIGGTLKKAGFRNPTDNQINVDTTLLQSQEGSIVRAVSHTGVVYTVPILEPGTTITIMNDDSNDAVTLREGSGVALSVLAGGDQLSAAPDLFLAQDSVCQLTWMSNGTTVKAWGNGLSN